MGEVIENKKNVDENSKKTVRSKKKETTDEKNLNVEGTEISLKEIKQAIESKVDKNQKKEIVIDVLINIGIAVIMVVYLIFIMMGSKNIDVYTLEKDMKIIALSILAIGIFIIEASYRRDIIKNVMHGIEVIVYGAVNLCLIYTVKLYFENLTNIVAYVALGIGVYYIFKSIVLSFAQIRKFKKQNNDIKEIIKK